MNYFNPASPKWKRGVFLVSVYACSVTSVNMVLMADYGPKEHIFSGIQKVFNENVDKYFGITQEELEGKVAPPPAKDPNEKPFVRMKWVSTATGEEIKPEDRGTGRPF
jgi:hypothetical protein